MSYLNIKKLHIFDKLSKILDFSLNINTSTALIGQSGSGKSLTLKSILSLLPSNLDLNYEVESDFERSKKNIGFIPQNPFTPLPTMTKSKQQFFCTEDKTNELLKLVGLDLWVLDSFTSQLSGGQLQRVVIAISLSSNPKLILLDEPTTALDQMNKQTILELLEHLQDKLDILILFVTHDIHSIKNICKQLAIINNGEIVEMGNTEEILNNPQHMYTKELLNTTFENRRFRK